MGDVDKLQEAEERAEQLEQERREAERKEQREELMQDPVAPTADHDRSFADVPLGLIRIAQNMRSGDLPDVQGLAISIREVGLIHPLLVRETGEGTYRLVAGRRRFAALKLAFDDNPETLVQCEVIASDADEAELWRLMLTENLQREDSPPLDVARALRNALRLDPELSASALARSLGKSAAWASRHLHLLDLPEAVQWRLEAGDLNFTIADLIRQGQKKGILDDDQAEELAQEMASGDKDVDELKALVRPKMHEAPENYEELSRELDAARFGPKERGFEPDEGVDPEQADWEAGRDEGGTSAPRTERAQTTADTPWVTDDAAPASRADGPAYGDRQLDSYLIGRMLRYDASEALLDELGIDRDKAFDFAWKLGTDEDRIRTFRQLAADLIAEDDDLPSFISR